MQLVHITTDVCSSRAYSEVYSTQYSVIKNVSDLRQVGCFLRVLGFPPPIKLTSHDIIEMVLKVALNTITLTISIEKKPLDLHVLSRCNTHESSFLLYSLLMASTQARYLKHLYYSILFVRFI